MTDSPYLFRSADHPLHAATDRLKVREAVSGFGIALRYQGPRPIHRGCQGGCQGGVPEGVPEGVWCETGHSIFILSGRIRYRFDTNSVEAGPGDMLHIPAGPEHRHKPAVIGSEVVCYVLTEFDL